MEDLTQPLDATRIEEILGARFTYYSKLSVEEKKVFVERVGQFISIKEFIPREHIDITAGIDDIKVLISASAIQATFGLAKFELPHFSKIFIYPREYYSTINRHWHKGEANPIGALVFSWKDFKEGYQNETDKINLGLHETAHAMMLSRAVQEGGEQFFNEYFDKWWAVSNAEFQKLEKHQISFFRDYGGTNSEEFFAVCVECFFEAANEFKAKHPEIYRQMCILLNQDPSGDFNNITNARERLIQEQADQVVPANLIYKTKGRTLINLLGGSGIFAAYFFFVGIGVAANSVTDSLNVIIFIFLILLVVFLAYRYISYTEFYVFENAFAVGYERHGMSLEKILPVGPSQCISISFLPQSDSLSEGIIRVRTFYKSSPKIRIMYMRGKTIVSDYWDYDHIRSKQIAELKQAVKDYCSKNKVAYHDLDR